MKRMMLLVFALALSGAASAGEWHIEMVDSYHDTGYDSSLALDSFGYPHISYRQDLNDDLKYAYFDGASWHNETVDTASVFGVTSLALDSNDYPHIAYSAGLIKYAHWDGVSWIIEEVGSGNQPSLALDSNDYPHISFHMNDGYGLKYASWDGNEWQIQTVEYGYLGNYSSLVLDSSEYPHISYQAYYDLSYAKWNGSSWQIETVDSEGYMGYYTSLALDSNDYPHISYCSSPPHLKYAYRDGAQWYVDTVDSGNAGWYTSLALDDSDYPHIAYCSLYWDGEFYVGDDLKYAQWGGSSWWIDTVTSISWSGGYSSLALDDADLPHIAYYGTNHARYAWYESGPGVEGAELSANTCDEGVLVNWVITGDIPASFSVLRSVGNSEPVAIHDNPLPGSATHYLDRKDKGLDKGFQPLAAGTEYCYWLEVTEADGTVKRFGPTEAVQLPEPTRKLSLSAYPSPAADSVTIAYTLPDNGCVTLSVYDLSGRRVATLVNSDMTAGRHEVSWSCADVESGVYLYRLEAGAGSLTRRLVVSR